MWYILLPIQIIVRKHILMIIIIINKQTLLYVPTIITLVPSICCLLTNDVNWPAYIIHGIMGQYKSRTLDCHVNQTMDWALDSNKD